MKLVKVIRYIRGGNFLTGCQLIWTGGNLFGPFLLYIPITMLIVSVFLNKTNPLFYIILSLTDIYFLFILKNEYRVLIETANKVLFSSGARMSLIGSVYVIIANIDKLFRCKTN